jgi:hypothetical protein
MLEGNTNEINTTKLTHMLNEPKNKTPNISDTVASVANLIARQGRSKLQNTNYSA